ncbi:Hsp70 family protein [Aporhodopirellula aestuarii]|uniref:Hsp70 family protein n=1 Tax=Aporhodopirellula aestuarii TaxID=2950107 RepID=A0ABT0U4K9_9BACT|nr:Hsp70 family protein [Aporhodopirellula aestuarii]MCM2371872.1 Hsp70 family protein [Aporhodopirellula aestuarii]
MNHGPTIAIDFGTTRTKVAYYDEKRDEPRLISLGKEYRDIIPSVFHVPVEGAGVVTIGDDAMLMIDQDPGGIVRGLKREIGSPGVKLIGPGRLTPTREELVTKLFAEIRQRCESEVFHGCAINTCTIAVPVLFSPRQRKCLEDAAIAAGFTQVGLVDEASAAARAWASEVHQRPADHIVVCDIGGGTTDFSLVSWDDDRFLPHSDVLPSGLMVGGNDIDDQAFAALLNSQKNESTVAVLSRVRESFLVKMQSLKLFYSRGLDVATLVFKGKSHQIPRRIFQSAAEDFTTKANEALTEYINKCSKAGVDAPSIILVGGTSQLAGLKESIEQLAPQRTYTWASGDFATVLGAAILGRREECSVGNNSAAMRAYTEALGAAMADGPLSDNKRRYLLQRRESLRLGEETASVEKEILGEALDTAAAKHEASIDLPTTDELSAELFRDVPEETDAASTAVDVGIAQPEVEIKELGNAAETPTRDNQQAQSERPAQSEQTSCLINETFASIEANSSGASSSPNSTHAQNVSQHSSTGSRHHWTMLSAIGFVSAIPIVVVAGCLIAVIADHLMNRQHRVELTQKQHDPSWDIYTPTVPRSNETVDAERRGNEKEVSNAAHHKTTTGNETVIPQAISTGSGSSDNQLKVVSESASPSPIESDMQSAMRSIRQLWAEGKYQQVVRACNETIESGLHNRSFYQARGRAYARVLDWSHAVADYLRVADDVVSEKAKADFSRAYYELALAKWTMYRSSPASLGIAERLELLKECEKLDLVALKLAIPSNGDGVHDAATNLSKLVEMELLRTRNLQREQENTQDPFGGGFDPFDEY